MQAHILLIDKKVETFSETLKILNSFPCRVTFMNNREVRAYADLKKYDLILMEALPTDPNGLAKIRKYSAAPILIVTSEQEMPLALSMRADDYVIKPFDRNELYFRIENLLRGKEQVVTFQSLRLESKKAKPPLKALRFDRMTIFPVPGKVQIGEQWFECTPKEFALLWLFANHPNKIWSRKELLEKVWGKQFTGSATLADTNVKHLRSKLKNLGYKEAEIVTIPRKGYKFQFIENLISNQLI